jgi:predicted Zn-dependent protease
MDLKFLAEKVLFVSNNIIQWDARNQRLCQHCIGYVYGLLNFYNIILLWYRIF